MVSAELFPLLGVKPVLGRTFLPEEDRPGPAPCVVIGEGLWKRKFGMAPDVPGRSVTLNGKSHTIVGVAPAGFTVADDADVYVPIGQWTDETFRDRRVSMGMRVVGRLKPGLTPEEARADVDRIGRDLEAAYPEADKGTGIALVPLKKDIVGNVQGILLVLLGAVSFVLLIACANVANLLLARSTGRDARVRRARGARGERLPGGASAADRERLARDCGRDSGVPSWRNGARGQSWPPCRTRFRVRRRSASTAACCSLRSRSPS